MTSGIYHHLAMPSGRNIQTIRVDATQMNVYYVYATTEAISGLDYSFWRERFIKNCLVPVIPYELQVDEGL